MVIASYLIPLLTSRSVNFTASSIIHRIGDSSILFRILFSLAHVITGFDESKCVTFAPAFAAKSEAIPV